MPLFPDTPKTLLDELSLSAALDEAKWRQFDDLYRPVVHAFLMQRFPSVADEADDVIQETMVRLVQSLKDGRYQVERGRFRTFLGAIVNNLAIDLLRRRTRYATLPLEEVDWVTHQSASAQTLALLDRQWREACYRAARHRVLHRVPLPPHYAEVWRMLEKGAASADVAVRFNVTSAFVRQVKHRMTELIAAEVKALG